MNRSERLPIALYFIAVIALMLLPFAADAQESPVVCGPWETARKLLEKEYHETIVGSGIINDKTVVVVFASDDGETFTMLSLAANGIACKLMVGGGWSFDVPVVGKPS